MEYPQFLDFNRLDFYWISDPMGLYIKGLCIFSGRLHEFIVLSNKNGSIPLLCSIGPLTFERKLSWIKHKRFFYYIIGNHWCNKQSIKSNWFFNSIINLLYFVNSNKKT